MVKSVAMNKTNLRKREKIKKVLIVILIIWLLKIVICVAIREYQNSNFLWMYENSDSRYVLHIDRKFHFMDFKYGFLGVSYHYTVDVYDFLDTSRIVGTDDIGTFRISLLYYGYIQDNWPISLHTDRDITINVQEND